MVSILPGLGEVQAVALTGGDIARIPFAIIAGDRVGNGVLVFPDDGLAGSDRDRGR